MVASIIVRTKILRTETSPGDLLSRAPLFLSATTFDLNKTA